MSIFGFGRREDADQSGWRNGHPFLSTIGRLSDHTLTEIATIHRHMRDCSECRAGWRLVTGEEWDVPATFKAES